MSKSRIFLFLMLCFIGGVGLRSFVFVHDVYLLFGFGILAIVLLSFSQDMKVVLYAAALIVSVVGMLWYGRFEPKEFALERFVGQKVEWGGRIVKDPEIKSTLQRLVLSFPQAPQERVLVTTKRYPEFAYGDTVRLSGTLKKPENFSTFNYAQYLAKDDIYFVMNFASVELVKKGEGSLRTLFALKRQFEQKVNAALAFPHSAFVNGILLGSTAEIPKELDQAFIATGVSHVLALSGYNVSVIVLFVSLLLSFLFTSRTTMLWFVIVAVTLFVVMTGSSPSVVRAALMGVALLLARELGRQRRILNVLVCAALVMILFNPRILLFDISFQLSFLAVLGLAYIFPYLTERLKRIPEFLKLKESFITTISAQIAVLPLLLYTFHQFSFVSPLANMLVLPAIPYAMLFGFLTGIAGFLSDFLAQAFAYPTWLIVAYQLSIVRYLAHFSYATLSF